jgi:UDP-N-acetylglucosamine 4,6-dehydratase
MKSVLVTGATGTFGRAFIRERLTHKAGFRIVVYSRDEQKQEELERELSGQPGAESVRYMLGDIRDANRLQSAMRGINTVIHAAALKIVPRCEYSPIEAVSTNIGGAENVIRASIAAGVSKVIALSTDKAVNPINLYGATKLVAERLFIAANHLSGSPGNPDATRFSCVRYGNVAFSRGSVIPLFKKLSAEGNPLPITHPEMTRFWITIDQAVAFVIQCLGKMDGGEVFIPRMPSFYVTDLADAIVPTVEIFPERNIVGLRPGEKIAETLITPHDARYLTSKANHFIINPNWLPAKPDSFAEHDFIYSSDTNTEWLSVDDLRRMVK